MRKDGSFSDHLPQRFLINDFSLLKNVLRFLTLLNDVIELWWATFVPWILIASTRTVLAFNS